MENVALFKKRNNEIIDWLGCMEPKNKIDKENIEYLVTFLKIINVRL